MNIKVKKVVVKGETKYVLEIWYLGGKKVFWFNSKEELNATRDALNNFKE